MSDLRKALNNGWPMFRYVPPEDKRARYDSWSGFHQLLKAVFIDLDVDYKLKCQEGPSIPVYTYEIKQVRWCFHHYTSLYPSLEESMINLSLVYLDIVPFSIQLKYKDFVSNLEAIVKLCLKIRESRRMKCNLFKAYYKELFNSFSEESTFNIVKIERMTGFPDSSLPNISIFRLVEFYARYRYFTFRIHPYYFSKQNWQLTELFFPTLNKICNNSDFQL